MLCFGLLLSSSLLRRRLRLSSLGELNSCTLGKNIEQTPTVFLAASNLGYRSVFFFNFTKLQFLNDKNYSYTKKNYLALGNLAKLMFWSILSYFCQLEIDHVTQQPKETCQRTGRGQHCTRCIKL